MLRTIVLYLIEVTIVSMIFVITSTLIFGDYNPLYGGACFGVYLHYLKHDPYKRGKRKPTTPRVDEDAQS